MSQAGGPSSIGSISVDVTANTDALVAGMAKAESETKAAAKKIEDAARIKLPAVLPTELNRAAMDFQVSQQRAARAGFTRDDAAELERLGKLSAPPLAEAAQAEKEIEQNTKAANASLVSQAAAVRDVERTFRLATAGAAALVTVGNAVATTWKYLTDVFGNGKKVADDYIQTIGEGVSQDAEPALKKLQERLIAVNSELAYQKENANNVGRDPIEGRSSATIQAEITELLKTQTALSNQVRAQRNQRFVLSDDEAKDRELDKDIERSQRRVDILRLEADQRRQIEDAAFDLAEERAERHFDRINELGAQARKARDQLNPVAGLNDDAARIAQQMQAALAKATDPMQRMLITMFGDAILKGIELNKKKIADALENALIDALNGATQASGGTGSSALVNMTSSLQDIASVTRAIQMSIPRDSP